MKGDIIFALFTAFMLIAIAVGFYMQWNPSVTAILLGMLFTKVSQVKIDKRDLT